MASNRSQEVNEENDEDLSLTAIVQLSFQIEEDVKEQSSIKEQTEDKETPAIPFLLGPGAHKNTHHATNTPPAEPKYNDINLNGNDYPFSPPTGSYSRNQVPVSKSTVLHVSEISVPLPAGLEPSDNIPRFSLLQTNKSTSSQRHIIRYSRERLGELNTRSASPDSQQELVQAQIEENFPEICRPPSDAGEDGLDLGRADETEEFTLALRSYQEEFAEKGLHGENDVILLPTGSGKTYIAIAIIKEHLRQRADEHVKVVFLAPTQDLVSQQLKLIRKCMPDKSSQCRAITGDDNLSHEMVAYFIKDGEYLVLVMTPAILDNYFSTSDQAALSDFTLLLFDEMHHTKKCHNYNLIIHRYLAALHQGEEHLPQLIGMTATIGIGKNKTAEGAKSFILDMCTKYNLSSFPWRQELYLSEQPRIREEVREVKTRSDQLSGFIERQLMSTLEDMIITTFERKKVIRRLGEINVVFPEVRTSQVYEQYIVNLLTTLTELPHHEDTKADLQSSRLTLKHLREYYRSLQLINLLDCSSGFVYLERKLSLLPYQGVRDISDLFQGNLEPMREIQEAQDRKNKNDKLVIITDILRRLFERKPDSKVIIFVQMRLVAMYLAKYLTEEDPKFSAREFTSIGKSPEEAGMNPQQRIDVRAKFEGSKYNILVATSVLEEGIDIQACIMVIRYMYVKDMIAKIQSMGRARHPEGTLVSLLDEKLLKQERDNNFKAGLMFEALSELKRLSDDQFQEELRQRRPTLLKALDTKFTTSHLRDVSSDIEICCAVCSSFLGYLKDVFVFKKTHHLIIDSSLHERVDFFPKKTPLMDGDEGIGKLNCKHVGTDGKQCNTQVGRVVKMGCGYSFGMWNAKGGISLREGSKTTKISRWKDIKDTYRLKPVYSEELSELGPLHQFLCPEIEP